MLHTSMPEQSIGYDCNVAGPDQVIDWQGQYQVPDLRTGDAVVFPSNLCFPHEVRPVTAGTRYVLVTWFC